MQPIVIKVITYIFIYVFLYDQNNERANISTWAIVIRLLYKVGRR